MTEFAQQQNISQQQLLSNRQLQSLKLLSVPIFELETTINDIVETNPVLEFEEFAGEQLNTPIIDENYNDDNENNPSDEYNYNDDSDNWANNDEAQKQRDNFFENILEEESMQQQLIHEASYLNLSAHEFEIAESIISSIGENGILVTPLADIAMATNSDMEEVEKILQLIQSITIPGIAARDLPECLKLQLIAKGDTNPLLFTLIDNFLEEISQNHLVNICRDLNISMEELNQLLAIIRELNPHPGLLFSSKRSEFIIPEAEIKLNPETSEYYLILNDYYIPKIKISSQYSKLLETKELSKEDYQYLKQKLNDANNFKNSLAMREKTIERIARIIMNTQHDFWANGVNSLTPMTMAEIASQLELHEATISRACSNKYLQTPQGLFEFKYFFTHGIKSDAGNAISNLSIKEKIKNYISNESPSKPLSDDKISELLKNEGINISRRTVAKYRDAQNIPATHLRKIH